MIKLLKTFVKHRNADSSNSRACSPRYKHVCTYNTTIIPHSQSIHGIFHARFHGYAKYAWTYAANTHTHVCWLIKYYIQYNTISPGSRSFEKFAHTKAHTNTTHTNTHNVGYRIFAYNFFYYMT